MTVEECKEKYPLHTTLIGWYSTDQSFSVEEGTIDDIEDWEYAPLTNDNNIVSFIRYIPEKKEFECWFFGFTRVIGYLVEENDVKLATYMEDFGYDIIDPENPTATIANAVIYNDFVTEQELPKYIAAKFDLKAYKEGRIFTTYEDLRKFCENL